MADICESSSAVLNLTSEKTVVVRVKRKAVQAPLDAFWLEINGRPLKRQLLDFEKLSIAESTLKEELKSKRVFVQHVETVRNTEVTLDILQSYVPRPADEFETIARSEKQRHAVKKETQKRDQLLSKAREKQEGLAKNARFEQIWRSRRGDKEAMHDKALHQVCDLYDVVRVDFEEMSNEKQVDEDMSLEEQMILQKFLPLMEEHIPSAAAAIESDIRAYLSYQTSADDYVYDLYTVKGDMNIVKEDPSNPFPLVQVDNDDDFYDGPPESEYESDDSNAEDNPRNDYPDEETSDDEVEAESNTSAGSESEKEGSSNKSTDPEDLACDDQLEDADLLCEDVNDFDINGGYDYDDYCGYDHDDGDSEE